MAKKFLTDEEVEQEIERKKFLYQLRNLEKKGQELQDAGITMEILDGMEAEESEF